MTIQVKHKTSVQGTPDPTKSVNASEWNDDHFVSGAVSVGGLSASISVVEAHIDAISQQISVLTGGGEAHPTSAEFISLQADVSTEIANRNALSGTVSTLSVQHSNLSATVSSNAAIVSALSVAVSVVQANVSALSVSLSVVDARISNEISARTLSVNNLSAIVSTNLVQLNTLSALESTLSALHSTLSAQVSTVSVAVSNASAAVSVVAVNLNSLSQQVSTLSALESALSALHSTLSAQVSTVSVAVSNASAAVSVVAANLSSLSVNFSVLDARVSVNSVFMAGISGGGGGEVHPTSAEFVSLQADVSTAFGQGSVVAANLSALSVAVSVVQANVSTLSVLVSTVAAGLSNEISARALSVNNLSAVVSTNLAQVSTLSALESTLSALHSTLSAQHSTLSVQVSQLSAQMTSLMANKAVVKGSQIISVSALTNVSGMSFSVGAGNTYLFKYYVVWQGASISSGLGLSVTFPGMKNFAAMAQINSGVDGVGGVFSGAITTSGDKVQALSVQTSATDYYATVEGMCNVSTSGTLQLQANALVGGNTVQVVIREGTAGAIWRTG